MYASLRRLSVAWSVVLSLAVPGLLWSQADGPNYRIGPRDLIDIRVFEEPQLNVERRVSEEGMLNLPLIGEFPAAGLTERELADRLKAHLESVYLQRASVTVQVREFLSRPISVIGAVRNPGNLERSGRMTLLEALTEAGGVDENRGRVVYVLRRSENGLSDQLEVDLQDLMLNNEPSLNIPIFPNDVINVPGATPVTVYFLGAVGGQGALNFQAGEQVTLLAAVARAGGLSDRASSKITIRRRDRFGNQREIQANYKRILAGKDADVELQDGDIVVVKESFF